MSRKTKNPARNKAERVGKVSDKKVSDKKHGDSYGNRTRVAGVRGRSLNRLTNEPNMKESKNILA